MRVTLNSIPTSNDLLLSSALPLAVIIEPFAQLRSDEGLIPIIESAPVRCNSCSGFINPHVLFLKGGNIFICNLCNTENKVGKNYYAPLDINGRRTDISSRPELMHGTVEYVEKVPIERKSPAVLFLLDASKPALVSGAFASFIDAITEYLSSIQPGLHEFQVGFITFDRHLHFYDLRVSIYFKI